MFLDLPVNVDVFYMHWGTKTITNLSANILDKANSKIYIRTS